MESNSENFVGDDYKSSIVTFEMFKTFESMDNYSLVIGIIDLIW